MTTITRACEHAGINYKQGDHVEDHDVAEHLVRLGFAKTTDADVKAALASDDAGNGKTKEK